MLSDEEKKEMLADARDPQRRVAFASSGSKRMTPMTWEEYFQFLKSVQNIFPQDRVPHKITGTCFKL